MGQNIDKMNSSKQSLMVKKRARRWKQSQFIKTPLSTQNDITQDQDQDDSFTNLQEKQQNISEKQKLRRFFKNFPEQHTGESLKDFDKEIRQIKQKVSCSNNKIVNTYFKSRIDVNIVSDYFSTSQKYKIKWADRPYPLLFQNFKPNHQIINHIQNFKDTLSNKYKFVQVLREYDSKKKYNFNSDDFHFKSFLLDLENYKQTDEDKEFFDLPNKGYWLMKDPIGSQGNGITLHRGTNYMKYLIRSIKTGPKNTFEYQQQKNKYNFIQSYLDNPLLMNEKKIDSRCYALIASVKPFVLLYQNGFIRQCIEKYDLNFKTFNQVEAYKHLTNTSYQKHHPDYQKEQDNLIFTYKQFEDYLRLNHDFDDEKLFQLNKNNKKCVAYTVEAGKSRVQMQKGMFQLMGIDLIWDENYNSYLIELNVSPRISDQTKVHKQTVPQLVQSTLDLILDTHEDLSQIEDKWKNPEKLDLGRWEILINEATGYNILDEYKIEQKEDNLQDNLSQNNHSTQDESPKQQINDSTTDQTSNKETNDDIINNLDTSQDLNNNNNNTNFQKQK